MKTVLHFRIDAPGFNSDAIARGFVDNSYKYHWLNWQQERFSNGLEHLQIHALQLAEEIKPDIIFCHIQNPEIFDIELWKALSKNGFVINYSFDVRKKEKSQWMYDVAKFIGYSFFGCDEDVAECLNRGIANVEVLQSSCDMEVYKPIDLGKMKPAFDVVFCGNNYVGTNLDFPLAGERQRMIEFLEKNYQNNFGCYGLGQKGGMILPDAEARAYNFSKIAVCQNNFRRTRYTSDRLWRIMASGTMCLCKWFPGIENMFRKEVDLDWWNNFDELKNLIDFYLGDDGERNSIAKAGSDRVRKEHTWTARISEMEKIVGEYRNSLVLNR